MGQTYFLRTVLSAAVLHLSLSAVVAQIPDSLLRPHIVHELDPSGLHQYRDDRIPTFPDTTVCFLYVGQKQNGPLWIRLQVRYAAYNALGISQVKFSKGDKALELTPSPDLLHYGTNGMMQWEWYDTPPSENEVKVILAIIAEPGVKLTLKGKDHVVERELSETERLAMGNVLEQARLLGRVAR